MSSVRTVIVLLLNIFILCLFGRVILDYVRIFSSSWRPKGIVLALAELIYAVTDPVIKFVRRFIPSLRIGPVAVDISFLLVFFVARILISFASRIN